MDSFKIEALFGGSGDFSAEKPDYVNSLEGVEAAVQRLKAEGYIAVRISFGIFCDLKIEAGKSVAKIFTCGREATVAAGADGNWSRGELVFTRTPNGQPYLCLGLLPNQIEHSVLAHGACWIYPGKEAEVRVYFWLQRKKKFEPGEISDLFSFVLREARSGFESKFPWAVPPKIK